MFRFCVQNTESRIGTSGTPGVCSTLGTNDSEWVWQSCHDRIAFILFHSLMFKVECLCTLVKQNSFTQSQNCYGVSNNVLGTVFGNGNIKHSVAEGVSSKKVKQNSVKKMLKLNCEVRDV